jgi:hypothetical protein
MKGILVVVVVAVLAGSGHAQSNLSPEDWEALEAGEIDDTQHIVGGLVGTFFGLGLGHAVQGRMEDKGWMFLGGEVAGVAAIIIGVGMCVDEGVSDLGFEDEHDCPTWLIAGGVIALGVFRLWELVDVWAGPVWHNQRVREARARAFRPFVAPTLRLDGSVGGMQAGLSLRF